MVQMSKHLVGCAVALLSVVTTSCGNHTDTGRNADPTRWPTMPGADEIPGRGSEGGRNGRGSSNCFESTTKKFPDGLARLCEEAIKPEQAFRELYPILCEQGKIAAVLTQPSCGWNGNPQTIQNFIHYYYVQPDKTKDYEDVHATFVHAPVMVDKFLQPIRLAFENYDEFKRQGYQWVAGTREHRNLSGTTWEDGVEYRFRADKGLYEIGYQAVNKLYKLSPTLYVHLNRATGDYARIAEFSQIVLYQQQADQSTVSFKLEHRRIASQGLYEFARKSSSELLRDVMEKGYKNATKQ